MADDVRIRTVLMTTDSVGGVWTHALELARALGRRGVRVALATMGAPLLPSQREAVMQLPTTTVYESSYRLEWMENPWADVREAGDWLLRLERALQPDVVHLNQFAFGALPFVAPKLLVAHSCVLSWWRAVHDQPAPALWTRYRHEVRRGLHGADLVGAPTLAMLNSLATNYGYWGGGVVLPNGRSVPTFSPGPKEEVILFAGRLWDAAKNIQALEAVAPHLPWPIRVAGSAAAPGGHAVEPSGVVKLGELSPKSLAAELARAAIYALPARYEPFGQSALEAGLAGCALVLGDLESLREVWGDAALYVEPDDHDKLRLTLRRLIAEPSWRMHRGRLARARALRYGPEGMVRAYFDAYRRAHGDAGDAGAVNAISHAEG